MKDGWIGGTGRKLVSLLSVLALGLGCAGAALAQAKQPIRIGVLNDQTGPYSSITGLGSVAAAKLAIEDAGDVLGRPVEVLSADHQFKPDIGSSIARRWYDTESVGAIFDIYHSGVALAVQRIAEDKNKILGISMASSRDIGGKSCSPNGFQWANDGYAVANLTIKGAGSSKPNSWYFITVDYTAGHSIENDSRKMIESNGGTFVGSVRFPANSPDFASFLLQAQASKAKNIALIAGGADLTNAAKQALEFGIQKGGQHFIPFSMTTDDVYALGNQVTEGMPLVFSFYWDTTPATRAWTERFKKATGGKMPTDPQANVYSEVLHYLKAVKAAGTTDTKAVLAKMKSMPVQDFFTDGAHIRADGRLMRKLAYAVAKAPGQMKNRDDILTIVKWYSGEEAFTPVSLSDCPLLHKK